MQVFFYNRGQYTDPIEARKYGALYRTPSDINTLTNNTQLQLTCLKQAIDTFCECAGLEKSDWGVCYIDDTTFKTLEGEVICDVF